MYPFTLSLDLSSLTMPLTVMRQVMVVAIPLGTQIGEQGGVSRRQQVRPGQGDIVDALRLGVFVQVVDGRHRPGDSEDLEQDRLGL